MQKRIILFGGSFDPIHLGHVTVAKSACDQIGADKVIFIPARRSPHKKNHPQAPDNARFDMISLAISEEERFCVSDCEITRPDPSYTIDTVRFFKASYPAETRFYWLIGADTLTDLHRWHQIDELIDECSLSIMNRGGVAEPDLTGFEGIFGSERVEKLKNNMVSTPLIDASSTEIRAGLGSGGDVSGLLNPKVLAYIRDNGLYR
jgi:nicotinate-nucleotide adenylyltransferase